MPPFKTVRVQRAPARPVDSAHANISSEKPAKVYTQSHSITPVTKKEKEQDLDKGKDNKTGIREIIA